MSGEKAKIFHTWAEQGTYIIKAKAKDISDYESEWGTLKVTMPKNQQIWNMWFSQFLEKLPFLLRLLFKIFNKILLK